MQYVINKIALDLLECDLLQKHLPKSKIETKTQKFKLHLLS